MKLIDRTDVLENCKSNPFKIIFTLLGDYESLEFDVETEDKAKEKLDKLKRQFADDIVKHGGYHADILKRIFVESKTIEKDGS